MKLHRPPADDALSRVPIFAGLGARELDHVRNLLTDVAVAEGSVLMEQGSFGHEFFIVESGAANVVRDGTVVGEIGPGDFLGEISLLVGGPRSATITATSPMRILVANHGEFSALLDEVPVIARQMLPALATRIRSLAGVTHTD